MTEEVASRRLAMATALFGAAVLSFAPLLYQYSDTSPVTGAFFRMLYAVPILAVLALSLIHILTLPTIYSV